MGSITPSGSEDPTLHLPRILCLHGGGVNADVYRMQARTFITSLKHSFRLVFAEGPFFCDPHPAIHPVYTKYGPFRRWLRWLPEQTAVDKETAVDEVWWQLNDAIDADDRAGADGEWVGLMGFSQGAKVSASLLYEQQVREEKGLLEKMPNGKDRPHWRFGILMAGRAPLVSFMPLTDHNMALVTAGEISEGYEYLDTVDDSHILRIPTIHVHGLADEGLPLHRRLMEQYCDPKTVTVVEWDGDHRVPYKTVDVEKVNNAMFEAARKTGVMR
jgi:hypothetical protein